jgi:hypothetical protein
VLPADGYTVTLRSAANGFKDASGELLDGDGNDTPGGNFTTTFTVGGPTTAVVDIPNFARGPGQSVDVPATSASNDLPLRISDGTGVTSITLTLRYNPVLLSVMGGATTLPGATVNVNTATAGAAVVTFTSTNPLGPGPVVFARLVAVVPSNAPYTSKHVLDIDNLQVNAGAIASRDDDGVHVVAYAGDTTGNGTYSGSDGANIVRVGVGLSTGFAAYQLLDPVIVGDVTSNSAVTALDAAFVLDEAVGIDRPEIAPIPPGGPVITPVGPDPVLSLGSSVASSPGGEVVVPVNLDRSDELDSVDLALSYDARRLELVNVKRGSLTADFDIFVVNHDAQAGTVRIVLARTAGRIFGRGSGSVAQLTFRVRDDAPAGRTIINLRQNLGSTTTQLNEGGLDLNPDPSNRAGDVLDGWVMILPRRRRLLEMLDRVLGRAD